MAEANSVRFIGSADETIVTRFNAEFRVDEWIGGTRSDRSRRQLSGLELADPSLGNLLLAAPQFSPQHLAGLIDTLELLTDQFRAYERAPPPDDHKVWDDYSMQNQH